MQTRTADDGDTTLSGALGERRSLTNVVAMIITADGSRCRRRLNSA